MYIYWWGGINARRHQLENGYHGTVVVAIASLQQAVVTHSHMMVAWQSHDGHMQSHDGHMVTCSHMTVTWWSHAVTWWSHGHMQSHDSHMMVTCSHMMVTWWSHALHTSYLANGIQVRVELSDQEFQHGSFTLACQNVEGSLSFLGHTGIREENIHQIGRMSHWRVSMDSGAQGKI